MQRILKSPERLLINRCTIEQTEESRKRRVHRYRHSDESFEDLKDLLTSPSVLAVLRADKPFVLDNYVNAKQRGCVLLQEQDKGSVRPIRYFSRTLKDAKRNCEATKRQ